MGIQDHFIANLYPKIFGLMFKVFVIDPQNKKGAIWVDCLKVGENADHWKPLHYVRFQLAL